jgi:hypothetical protein
MRPSRRLLLWLVVCLGGPTSLALAQTNVGQIAGRDSALNTFSTFDPRRFDSAGAPGVLASDGSLVAGTGSPTSGIAIFGEGFGDGRTAIRGGFGLFYDRVRTGYLSATAANPPFDRSSTVFGGNIDNPTGATQRAFPPNIAGIRDEMPTPRVMTPAPS